MDRFCPFFLMTPYMGLPLLLLVFSANRFDSCVFAVEEDEDDDEDDDCVPDVDANMGMFNAVGDSLLLLRL
jgi:hypothetical protein